MCRGPIDQASAIGKAPVPEQHVPLIVIGAGTAGVAAAITAAKGGVQTLLIDENPLGPDVIGLDVPLHFGQRANAAIQNKDRMVERIVANNPGLMEAFEAGIDVALGTYVFGAFINGETVHSMPVPMLGLADGTRSWMVSFDRLIVATGARDLAIAFEGWEKPGVMGARGWHSLVRQYNAFSGRRLLILGSGVTGLGVAQDALRAGHEIAGIVEVEAAPVGPADLVAQIQDRSVPIYAAHAVRQATGRAEVEGAVLVALDVNGAPIEGSDTTVACDTIIYALGAVPNIELLNVLGCHLEFRGAAGGYVPVVDAEGATSLAGIYAVGDCTGLQDPQSAAAQGEASAGAVVRSLAGDAKPVPHAASPAASGMSLYEYWQRWSRAEIAASGWDVHVCQCEEVTRAEIADLRPPRYLGARPAEMSGHNLRKLGAESPVNQDQVKRLTRAGMGPCQGRRCREQVHMLLSAVTGTPVETIPLATYRAPVRPLPLQVLAAFEELAAVRDNWVAWFNIPSQWTPHWEIDYAALETVTRKTGIADK